MHTNVVFSLKQDVRKHINKEEPNGNISNNQQQGKQN